MTAPVLNKVEPGAGSNQYTVSFYNPSKDVSAARPLPPLPRSTSASSSFTHAATSPSPSPHPSPITHPPPPQGKKAPSPTNPDVFLSTTPGMDVYVISYSGFSNGDTAKAKAAELMAKLKAAGEDYDASAWFTAGYDSPFTMGNRHNEVWIPKKGSGVVAPAAAKAAAGRRMLL
jgi:hypothetical protein